MKSRRLATYAASLAFVPAPPVAHYVYQSVDPHLNGGTTLVSAYTDTDTDTVYLPRSWSPFMRGHETGHLFDAEILTDGDRRYFQRTMHAPAGPWDHAQAYGRVEGEISPNEWFADYYGAMAARLTGLHGQSSVGSFATITPLRMRHFEKALARIAARRGLTRPYHS